MPFAFMYSLSKLELILTDLQRKDAVIYDIISPCEKDPLKNSIGGEKEGEF